MSNASVGLNSVSISCPNCGAAADFNPEDVVVSCGFCGTTFTRGKQEIEDHNFVAPEYSRSEAEKKIFDWIRSKTRFRGAGQVQAVKVEKMLIPYWVMKSHARSRFRGYRRDTVSETEYYTDSQGNRRSRTKHTTVYKPVNGTIDEIRWDPLICRMNATLFGRDKIDETVRRIAAARAFEPFDIGRLKDDPEDVEFLSAEIKRGEAKEIIETAIQDEHRSRAHSRTTELFDCRTTIEVQGMSFMHYPIVYVEYMHGKETYRVVMDGKTGRIIDGELPITTRFRVIAEIVAFTSLAVLWVAGFFMADSLTAEDSGATPFIYGVLALLVLGIALKTNATAWSTESRISEKIPKLEPRKEDEGIVEEPITGEENPPAEQQVTENE